MTKTGELWNLQLEREARDARVTAWSRFAEADDVEAVFTRLSEAEDGIAPDGDYEVGSALVEDDVLVISGLKMVLLTAEHATIQMRNELPKEADMGTGGLAEVAAKATGNSAVIAIGRQTSDGNYERYHPFKPYMIPVLKSKKNRAHLSLHMLDKGRASNPYDSRGYSIMLGMGNEPSDATLALKDYLVQAGDNLDLRVGVNAPHINFDAAHQLRRNEDDSIRTVTFAGAGLGTTRTFSQSVAKVLEKNDAFAALQVEINETLLVRQNDDPSFPSDWDRKLGSYLGYLFAKTAAESVTRL